MLFCFAVSAVAQTEMTTFNYTLENDNLIPKQKRSTLLKLKNLDRFEDYNLLLGLTLQKAIYDGNLIIYEDSECKNPISKNDVGKYMAKSVIDTVITYDPNNFEEEMKIIRTYQELFPTKRMTYGLEQNWNYNKKSNQIDMTIDKIHVNNLIVEEVEKKKSNVHIRMFSFKNGSKPTIKNREELDKANINWAKQIDYTITFENKNLREALLSKNHLNNHKIVTGYDRQKVFPEAELRSILNSENVTDTIITFDPVSFEESIMIVNTQYKFDAENITDFRVAQEFYFDVETNTIKSRILAVAPMRKEFDANGNFKYNVLLFWIVYDDDFQ